jgi:acid phosphatase
VRALTVTAVLGVTLAVTGCSGAGSNDETRPAPTRSGHSVTPTRPSSRPPSGGPHAQQGLPRKVLVVIEENHSLEQMRSGMPFLADLSQRYGYATDWQAIAHPSEPDYLAIVGGSTFGVTDDHPPSVNAAAVGSATSLLGAAFAAGRTAGTYAESMPLPCALADAYPYAVRHNPWTYFSEERRLCIAHDLDTTSFAADARANRLPDVSLLIPDLLHDAHDGSLAAADAWLRSELEPVLASRDFTSGDLVVVVTADEDDRRSGNTVLTSVLTPRLDHVVVSAPLTHYSLTRFLAQVLGVAPPGHAADAPDLATAFGLGG